MQSYARGPQGNVLRAPIGDIFLATAARVPQRLALVARYQDTRLTWEQYAYEAQRAAAGLRALGMAPGDRVGIWSTNCAEWAILQFGCALAGVVLVNINPAYRSHEMSFVLRQSGIKLLFLHLQDRRANYQTVIKESAGGQQLALQQEIFLGSPDWPALLREPDGATVS